MGNYDDIQVPVSGQPISSSLFGVEVRNAIIDLDDRTSDIESAIGGSAQEIASATNSATFSNTTPAESSPILGLSFVAPRSGRINISCFAAITLSTAGQIFAAPRLRTGGTLGSGTIIIDPTIEPNIKIGAGAIGTFNAGGSQIVPSLVPGDTYNVTMVHWCSSGSGLYRVRRVGFNPLPA